jgi:hypothetical protein
LFFLGLTTCSTERKRKWNLFILNIILDIEKKKSWVTAHVENNHVRLITSHNKHNKLAENIYVLWHLKFWKA